MPSNWFTLRHLFNFTWRASRTEFFLLHIILPVLMCLPTLLFASMFDAPAAPESAPLFAIAIVTVLSAIALACFIAIMAVNVRRLHDQEKSGWWWLVTWFPFVGWIFWLVFAFTRGDDLDNLYGPNPRDGGSPAPSAEAMARVFD